MYVMEKSTKWKEYLYLVGFSYRIGYQALLKMNLFEALYGRRWNVPVNWDKHVEWYIVGPEMLQDMEEQVAKIKKNLKMKQDR